MDIKEQVTKWVKNKIEKIIIEDLNEKITEENTSFDVEAYIDNLLDKYFNENDVKHLKESLSIDSYDSFYFDSENSSDERNASHNSLEFYTNEFHTFSIEEVIKHLKNESEEVKRKSLQALEVSDEDLMNQTSWNKLKEILQKMINNTESREIQNLVLKIFQKFLKHPKKTQMVCKGFVAVAEIITNQITSFNLKDDENKSFEQIYNIKENKWICEKKFQDLENPNSRIFKIQKSVDIDVLMKLMWLLIDCQQQIPIKWRRFNETMFREIIFSFIHLLSSTTTKNAKLSGLELLSVLNPKANWCLYWCHTAVGRSLLCSALRKYKNFFVQMVDIILSHMKRKKPSRLPSIMDNNKKNENLILLESNITETLKPLKKYKNIKQMESEKSRFKARHFDDRSNSCCSAPSKLKENTPSKYETQKKSKNSIPESITDNIPREIVNEAVFLHCISFVTCLIQFRGGRALFPIQAATRKRLLSVQDLVLSIIEYLENSNTYKGRNAEIIFTSAYKAKVSEILHKLKNVKTHVNSSRMSTEKQQFSYP